MKQEEEVSSKNQSLSEDPHFVSSLEGRCDNFCKTGAHEQNPACCLWGQKRGQMPLNHLFWKKRMKRQPQFKTRWPQCLFEVRSLLLRQLHQLQCHSPQIPRTPWAPWTPWTPWTPWALPPLQTIINSTPPNLPGLKPRRTRGGRYWQRISLEVSPRSKHINLKCKVRRRQKMAPVYEMPLADMPPKVKIPQTGCFALLLTLN